MKVLDILKRHFPENEYAILPEVRNAAGHQSSRSADYVLMNMWPSRGLAVHGIEMKSGRGDWLKEIKSPEKAEAIFKYCDYWWLLTTNDNVAKIDEIPDTWGWKHISNGKIRTIKEAPKLKPAPLERGIIASMIRRASDKTNYIHSDSIQDHIKRESEAQVRIQNRNYERMQKEYDDLKNIVSEFEKHSGIRILNRFMWGSATLKNIGKAVDVVAKHDVSKVVDQIDKMKEQLKIIHDNLENELEYLQSLEDNG